MQQPSLQQARIAIACALSYTLEEGAIKRAVLNKQGTPYYAYKNSEGVSFVLAVYKRHLEGYNCDIKEFPDLCYQAKTHLNPTVGFYGIEAEQFRKPATFNKIGTLDMTPSWESLLPMILEGFDSDGGETYNLCKSEITKMAKAADEYVRIIKERKMWEQIIEDKLDLLGNSIFANIEGQFGLSGDIDEDTSFLKTMSGGGKVDHQMADVFEKWMISNNVLFYRPFGDKINDKPYHRKFFINTESLAEALKNLEI